MSGANGIDQGGKKEMQRMTWAMLVVKNGKKKKDDLSRRELNPGLERLKVWLTSSHTDHYTTEDLQVLITCRSVGWWELLR